MAGICCIGSAETSLNSVLQLRQPWTTCLSTTIDGANRSTLAPGLNYALMPGVMLKGEFRLDHADIPVFNYVKDGTYKKDNQLFGLSTVVSF